MRKILPDSIYEWMLKVLPKKIMWVKTAFDGAYIWVPRWGYTQRQIMEADKYADNLLGKLKFDK